MNDGLDWWPIAARVRRGWRVVALTALVAVAVSVGLSLLDPYRYEAEAVLTVAKPDAELEFDPRFREAELNPASPYRVGSLRVYPELAPADALAQEVLEHLGETGERAASRSELQRRVRVQVLADGALISIRTRARSAAGAAGLANLWADVFSRRMEALFGNDAEMDAVIAARSAARSDLEEAEAALLAFQGTSQLPRLQVELDSAGQRYDAVLRSQDRLAAVVRDAGALGRQLEAGQVGAAPAALAALALQISALSSEPASPVELDLPAGGLGGAVTSTELAALADAAETARADLVRAGEALGLHLAELGREIAQQETELVRLERARSLAEERYLAVARKADELEVAGETTRPEVRLASPAVPPEKPELGRALQNALVALVLGLVAGVVVVLLLPPRFGGDA